MKAISLTQPWATLIAIGAKHYETRCSHRSCANCFTYAMRWYQRILTLINQHQDTPRQLAFA